MNTRNLTMNPAQIAAGLTPAQRRLILRGAAGGDECLGTIRAVIRRQLMEIRVDSPNGRYGPCLLTPLGQAVQHHLQAANHGC